MSRSPLALNLSQPTKNSPLYLVVQNGKSIDIESTHYSSQARANLAILEVKQAAMEEIRAARASRPAAEEAKEGGQVNILYLREYTSNFHIESDEAVLNKILAVLELREARG